MNMNEWRLIDSGPCPAAYNMALDEAISVRVRRGDSPPVLRLYGWDKASVSLGLFQKITSVDLKYCIDNKIPIVRRPTGGRGVLHGDELTYSLSARNKDNFSGGLLETYRKLSIAFNSAMNSIGLKSVMKAVREPGRNLAKNPLCFKSVSFGEISFNGQKLVGSAQKRWSDGFLQQGSIPYSVDEDMMIKIFRLDLSDYHKEAMTGLRTLVSDLSDKKFREAVVSSFEETFSVRFVRSEASQEELRLAKKIEGEKYLSPEWSFRQ